MHNLSISAAENMFGRRQIRSQIVEMWLGDIISKAPIPPFACSKMTSERSLVLLFHQHPSPFKNGLFSSLNCNHHIHLHHTHCHPLSTYSLKDFLAMYSLATRTALRRATVAPVSRTAAMAQRYSSTVHENDPEVSSHVLCVYIHTQRFHIGPRGGEAA